MCAPHLLFPLVCASFSCPTLRMEAYRSARLDVQLDEHVRDFLANPHKGLANRGNALPLSPIFNWFGDDFDVSGGVLPFVKRYRRSIPDDVDIRYFDYDWSVNARTP